MDDYIKREKITDILETAIDLQGAVMLMLGAEKDPEMKGEYKAYKNILKGVKEIPSADVVERKKGKWIRPVPGDGEPYCSECKTEAPLSRGRFPHHEYTNYCPNCGANLREDEAT